jgi:DNA helicase-2/ATP-dependent DNA helicase PcrA
MDPILDGLNDKQREAVVAADGSVLVLAGAGSGKTRVITNRFAYLIREKNLRMENILAVTFTNKAAGEMKERIARLTGESTSHSWVRTFHATGLMIIRRNPETIGYPHNFVIYDADDSKDVAGSVMQDLRINTTVYKTGPIMHAIFRAKDNMITPAEFENDAATEIDKITASVYREYEKRLRENFALDFNDLLLMPIRIFRENPRLLEYYQNLWRYMMIDEFQDTNIAQYQFMKLVVSRDKHICVVGDDDQSIYGWRGANIENIYKFKRDYEPTVVPLEQNYRSTQLILDAANNVVNKIPGRMEKRLWTARSGGDKIGLIETMRETDESRVIADTIRDLSAKVGYDKIAVFYRTNSQSRVLEEAMLRANIPYRIFGGQKFYERKEIKDVIAYIRLIINPFDRQAFERIVNIPARGVGNVGKQKLISYAKEMGISYVEVLTKVGEVNGIQRESVRKLDDLGQVLFELNQSIEQISPTNFVKILIDSVDYKKYIRDFDETGAERWENVEELVNSVKELEVSGEGSNIVDFINSITLHAEIDDLKEENERETVSLMTIHNAKGLEFPVVFISGVNDGLIPHSNSRHSPEQMEEERRLFYVAVTRAKDKLYMSLSGSRIVYGEIIPTKPSVFLLDIPSELFDPIQTHSMYDTRTPSSGKGMGKFTNRPAAAKPGPSEEPAYTYEGKVGGAEKGESVGGMDELKSGDRVRHPMLGAGTVKSVSAKLMQIEFDNWGLRAMGGNFLSSLRKI